MSNLSVEDSHHPLIHLQPQQPPIEELHDTQHQQLEGIDHRQLLFATPTTNKLLKTKTFRKRTRNNRIEQSKLLSQNIFRLNSFTA